MATTQDPKPAAPKRRYMVNWKLTGVGDKPLDKGDTIELTDDELKKLGIAGSGVLSRMRTAAEQKAVDDAEKAAEAEAKAAAEAEAKNKT